MPASIDNGYIPTYWNVSTTYTGTAVSSFVATFPFSVHENIPYSGLQVSFADASDCSIDPFMGGWNCSFGGDYYAPDGDYATNTQLTFSLVYGSPMNFVAGHSYLVSVLCGGSPCPFASGTNWYVGSDILNIVLPGGSGIVPPTGSGAPPPPTLAFPLAASTGTTPYTAPISAVLDHSITVSSGFSYYQYEGSNGFLQAYDGESGTGSSLCRYYTSANPTVSQPCDGNSHSIIGYLKDVGADAFNLPLLNYQSEDSVYPGKELLWYEGHSGYDYPVALDTAVYPATIGTLCVASNRTAPDSNGDLWRNSTMCPYGTDTIVVPNSVNNDSWDSWHQFYIAYPSQGNNNVTYATFYMHVDDLATSVKNDVLANGYSTVTDLTQAVALSGNTAPPSRPVGYHLHFELRKIDANGPTEIDPYGDGTSGNPYLLWQTQPQ